MRLIGFFIPAFVLLIFVASFNCIKTNQPTDLNPTRSVIFLDSTGLAEGYVPPVLAKLIVANDSMKMDSIQGSAWGRYWDAAIEPHEVDSLWRIINQNNCMGSPDPTIPVGFLPCCCKGGAAIIFNDGTTIDTIIMNRGVNCPTFWSTGLRILIAYKDSLVNKYKP